MSARQLYETDPDLFAEQVRQYADRIRPLYGKLPFSQAVGAFLKHEDRLEGLTSEERLEAESIEAFQLGRARAGDSMTYAEARTAFRSYGLHDIADEDFRIAHLAKMIQSQTGKNYRDALRDAENEIENSKTPEGRTLKTY